MRARSFVTGLGVLTAANVLLVGYALPRAAAIARRGATRDRPDTAGITVRDASGRSQVVRP